MITNKTILLSVIFILTVFSIAAQSLVDVNNNGSIDIVDALLIVQYYVELMTQMPCPQPTPEPTPGSPQVSIAYVMHYLALEASTDFTLNDIKGSGFDTCIIFSIDGTSEGNFTFFGIPIFTDGNYLGPAGWPDKIRSLKTGFTSIKRLAFCLAGPYGVYKDYMNTYGTGPETAWYRNFTRLKELIDADAIDFNDEYSCDIDAMVKLGRMLDNIGYKVSLCPYNNSSVWRSIKSQLGDIVDAVNLQCYDGG